MVRANDIQEKLLHLIGWEQNYDTSDLKISDALTVSESGLYFQQIHPLLTLQNMSCIAPDFKNITFPEYDSEKEYSKGNIISYNEKLYKLLKDTNSVASGVKIPAASYFTGGVDCGLTLGDETTFINMSAADIRIAKSDSGDSINYTIGFNASDSGAFSFSVKTSDISIYPTRYTLNANCKIGSLSGDIKYKIKIAGIESEEKVISGSGNLLNSIYEGITEIGEGPVEIIFSGEGPMMGTNFILSYVTVMQDAYTSNAEYAGPDNTEYWTETNLFSEWLESKTKASIQKAIARYCNEKTAEGTNKPLCESRTLFDGTGRLVDTVKNKKNLVGFEIIPVRAKGVTTKINKICLQFTKAGEYTLYLMHSSMDAPVKIIKLNKIRDNSAEWFTVDDLYLPYQSEDNDAGGSWYLCYFQSELPEGSQAIRKNKDWSKEPCGSCSRRELLAWMAWSKYLEIHPFFVNEELVDAVNFSDDFNGDFAKCPLHLWDVENNQYTYDNNYGLNLEVTVSCDITDFIVEQRMMFQDVIAKQVAVDMLREFAYNSNVRTNRHSINASRLDILYEVDGDSSSMKKSGLSYQLDMAFKAIKLSTSGIDRVCLPCRNNGIKYRTV